MAKTSPPLPKRTGNPKDSVSPKVAEDGSSSSASGTRSPVAFEQRGSVFSIEISTPASGKNSRQLVYIGKQPRLIKSKAARASYMETESAARLALQSVDPMAYAEHRPMIEEDDVEVRAFYDYQRERFHVEVQALRPMPKGPKGGKVRTGRKRDLANMLEVVLDAMQGLAYTNDNQIARIVIERSHPTES